MNPDRGRRIVVILTLVTTIVAAIVAGLQVEASTRSDTANRESERLVLTAAAQQVSDTADEGFQSGLVTDVLSNMQQALVLEIAALDLIKAGDTASATQVGQLAGASRARAERAKQLSDIYSDPKYAATPDGFPDVQEYFNERAAGEIELVAQQNAAADDYNLWNSRSDTYVAILSVLAITFFMLGLAQVAKRMRPFLAICGGGLLLLAFTWAAFTATT